MYTAEQALRAIKARIDGVWDDPDLLAFGERHVNSLEDIEAIVNKVLEG